MQLTFHRVEFIEPVKYCIWQIFMVGIDGFEGFDIRIRLKVGVRLNKARALYLVRVSVTCEIHVQN